jgi:hypothetical protein
MLDITKDDIAALNDEDLRSLVGRLCESELRSRGISTSAVRWGGNQDAPDGGIDVRVRIQDGAAPGGFVPRTSTGFQVKTTDYSARLIEREMRRPSGELRSSIVGLIRERGAYIIASSGSDTSDSALNDRIAAMQSAVADEDGHEELQLDFYDRNRLASWTRNHSGIVLWVRTRIGHEFPGWKPYDAWATSPDGVDDEYLIDDGARLHTNRADIEGIDVTQGIDRIREILNTPRRVVRLAGLSGVGKTRFVQALCDDRVGRGPIASGSVVYTDMTDKPSPQPMGMISDLIALRHRAIVVIDNCPRDLHRRITELCKSPESNVSAITVEYDVQDDEPEGTDVFRLEPSSVDLIARLLARHFPGMLQLSADKIAEFSGGNARIALALAKTLERGESIAHLRDEELFRRLFHQRQSADDSLMNAAKACALLYSFQGEAITGDEAELPKIAALVGMNAQQVFAKVAQLKERDLVQRRDVWRAVLPHAVANRLATIALREIPLTIIEQQFDTNRLLKSFSRRLSYLHESDEAKRIAEMWLASGGFLDHVGDFNELGHAMFENVAPVSPTATLRAIERSLFGARAEGVVRDGRHRDSIGAVLRSIAYDASLFERCTNAMITLALAEQAEDRSHKPIQQFLQELFHVIYSGRHATVEQRAAVVADLLFSSEPPRHNLGLLLLAALLKDDDFLPNNSFEFGARVRNYGYWPSDREATVHWFETALVLARAFANGDSANAAAVRSMVAEALGRLWFLGPDVQVQFESFANEGKAVDFWNEGWIAVRYLLSHPSDENRQDTASVQRLRELEGRLQPKNLTEQIRAVVLADTRYARHYAEAVEDEVDPEDSMAAYKRANAYATELGIAACADSRVLTALLPELVRDQPARAFGFGRGLALGSENREDLWEQLTRAVAQTSETDRNLTTLAGFLNGLCEIDGALCEAILEDALAHPTLGRWFPELQSSVTITAAGVTRLKRSAVLGMAKPHAFRFLAWDRRENAVGADDLRTIILTLASMEGGYPVAAEILSTQLHSTPSDGEKQHPPELIEAGRVLLSSADFDVTDNSHDYHLSTIADSCLVGIDGSAPAQALCQRIIQSGATRTFRPYTYQQVLLCIFKRQPRAPLDAFYSPETETAAFERTLDLSEDAAYRRINYLDAVPSEEVLTWCEERPSERYPAVARGVSFQMPSNESRVQWTPIAKEMLLRAPDPLAVLKVFTSRFQPRGWSGSLAAILESRLGLLDQVSELSNETLDNYVREIRTEFVNSIAERRRWEDERDRVDDERFE